MPPYSRPVYDNAPETLMDACKKELVPLANVLGSMGISDQRRKMWRAEADAMAKTKMPETIIGITGESGAGKSSLLNAVLGASILPTSGLDACTSVVTSISYHEEATFRGKVLFMSSDEWRKELETLRHDMNPEDNEACVQSSESNEAWDKIKVIYPSLTKEQIITLPIDEILQSRPDIQQWLGSSKEISTPRANQFRREIAPFMEASRKHTGSVLWPIICEVKIHCNSSVLSSGATLVDLPGCLDSNTARNAIAANFRKNCNAVWIVVPINRAISNKIAHELFEESLKTQLLYGSLPYTSVILTKLDVLDCDETSHTVGLENDLEFARLEADVQSLTGDAHERQLDIDQHEEQLKELRVDIEAAESRLRSQESVSVPQENNGRKRRMSIAGQTSVKRQRYDPNRSPVCPSSNPGPSAGPLGKNQIKITLQSLHQKETDTKDHLIHAQSSMNDVREGIKHAKKSRARYCANKSAEHAIPRIRSALIANAASNVRLEDLPVFACSGREYTKLTDKSGLNDDPSYSTTEDDTGIPRLRMHCHGVTYPHRLRASNDLANRLLVHLDTIENFIECQSGVKPNDFTLLRDKWASRPRSLRDGSDTLECIASWLSTGFRGARHDQLQLFYSALGDDLGPAFIESARKAANDAITIVSDFGTGCKHYATFRAAIFRYGVYQQRNLNHSLASPFTDNLKGTLGWRRMFGEDIDHFNLFKKRVYTCVKELVLSIEESAVTGLQDRVRKSGELCLKETRRALGEMTSNSTNHFNRAKKDAWRAPEVIIKGRLRKGYEEALGHKGKGAFKKQKDTLETFVYQHRFEIYEAASTESMSMLKDAVDECDQHFQKSLERLAEKIEMSISAIWEDSGRNTHQTCANALQHVRQTLQLAQIRPL